MQEAQGEEGGGDGKAVDVDTFEEVKRKRATWGVNFEPKLLERRSRCKEEKRERDRR